jgi:hypothetical protein
MVGLVGIIGELFHFHVQLIIHHTTTYAYLQVQRDKQRKIKNEQQLRAQKKAAEGGGGGGGLLGCFSRDARVVHTNKPAVKKGEDANVDTHRVELEMK